MKRMLGILIVVFATAMTQAQLGKSDVPAFHDKPPAASEKLPAIWTPAQLAKAGFKEPFQKEAYAAAAKAPALMYQMPCLCHCDQHAGHTSLRSCFEGDHGAKCDVCSAEALYTYQMGKKGWTAKMIRDSILRGEYKSVDLQRPEHVM